MTRKEKFVMWLNKFNRHFNKFTLCFLYVFIITVLSFIIWGATHQQAGTNVVVTYSRPYYTVTFDPAGGGGISQLKTSQIRR